MSEKSGAVMYLPSRYCLFTSIYRRTNCLSYPSVDMRRWLIGIVVACFLVLLLLKLKVLEGSFTWTNLNVSTNHSSDALHVHFEEIDQLATQPEKVDRVDQTPLLIGLSNYTGLVNNNDSASEFMTMFVWRHLEPYLHSADIFPKAKEGLKEAEIAWEELMEEERFEALEVGNETMKKLVGKQCPYSVSSIGNSNLQVDKFLLQIPCGFIVDSSLTLVGVPQGAEGSFAIELLGQDVPGESDAPIILHYNVRLQGDEIANAAVIVQNTWTSDHGWAQEERCPLHKQDNNGKVDGLDTCIEQVGKVGARKFLDTQESRNSVNWHAIAVNNDKKLWFPFVNGFPFAATLWVGWEGFHMTVNGKHITSFEYRQNLEPSLVSRIRLKGNLRLISLMANGLPVSEGITQGVDLKFLKAPPLTFETKNILFIGVFSTGNNFDRRMALRRSWMQYEAIRSGVVTVRFFVGLHSNKQVNKEVWKEAATYGDIELMPFVDYYNIITLKTIAICIFGTKMVSSKYIMKTDDDTFVRVDEVLSILNKTKHMNGLLYGSLEFDARPHRNQNSKWFISNEEWPHSFYPPYALGPGYVISSDIAKYVVQALEKKQLKFFKLEDVSMGMWIEEYKTRGNEVHYDHDGRFINTGCKYGYVIAHYQNPSHMVCLWQKLMKGSGPVCCE